MADPAAPILDVAQTQLEIQAAAANGRDAIAMGVLGADVALIVAVITLEKTLGHTHWPLFTLGLSGAFALVALLQGGPAIGRTPKQLHEESRNKTESEIYRDLIAVFDRAIDTCNKRLALKAWSLILSIVTIIATTIITVATL